MKYNHIKIGTRGSKLALFQANQVKETLENAFPDIQVKIVVVKTKGDKILDVSLSKIGDKGLFTKEIEDQLLDDRVDIAVHSLKDLPTVLPDGLKIAGVLPRHEVRDALVSKNHQKLSQLLPGTVVATGSLRRKSQLLKYNPYLKIIDIRGNVETRLRKLKDGYCDALIMAGAGLMRLGYHQYITELLDPLDILPAVSQGIIAIESKTTRPEVDEIIDKINHRKTFLIGEAERTFMRVLEGGCQVPVAMHTHIQKNELIFTGYVGSLDGTQSVRKTISGKIDEAKELAFALANQIIHAGGNKILDDIRKQ
ncbi:MAG: hydroxymethylbilane synthase [Bacteroidota bacterium]